MKAPLFFILLLLVTFSCQNESAQAGNEMLQMEKEMAEKPNTNTGNLLLEQYQAYMNDHPADPSRAEYLFKAGNVAVQVNKFIPAVEYFSTLIREFPSTDFATEAFQRIGSVYGGSKLAKQDLTKVFYSAYLQKKPTAENKAELEQAINKGGQPLEAVIETLSTEMYNDSTNRIEVSNARDYITYCESLALTSPKHPKAQEYLLKAGETSRTIKSYDKALGIYDWVINAYPEHPKAAQAMFLKGFTLDNDLNQKDEARAIYESFLEKYPNDDFADDTQFLLSNLGKSDDEIIKNFEKQNQ